MTHEAHNETELEVIMSWEGTPLAQELRKEGAITVGEADSTFLLPAEVVSRRLTLASRDERGWVVDGSQLLGATLVASRGDETLTTDAPLVLEAGMVCEVRIGDFRFTVRTTEATPTTPRAPITLDRTFGRMLAGTFAFALLLIGLLMLAPPNASALSLDIDHDRVEYLRYELQSIARENPPEVPAQNSTGGGDGEAGEASPTGGDGEPGPVANPGRTPMRRGERPVATTASDVNNLGTFAALRHMAGLLRPADAGSPFNSLADDGRSWMALAGIPGGDGNFGGLDMTHAGVGTCTGDHCGDGVARLTRLMDRPGQNGRPGAPGTGDLGPGRDRPDVVPHMDYTTNVRTVGGLSRNDILRVVRRHRPEVLHCYSQQLQSRPDLAGRVEVQFLVSQDGSVRSSVATPAGGMTDRVGQCVAQSVSRWSFPQTEGVTSVRYPFVFTSR